MMCVCVQALLVTKLTKYQLQTITDRHNTQKIFKRKIGQRVPNGTYIYGIKIIKRGWGVIMMIVI